MAEALIIWCFQSKHQQQPPHQYQHQHSKIATAIEMAERWRQRKNRHTEKQQEFNFITHIRQIICPHSEQHPKKNKIKRCYTSFWCKRWCYYHIKGEVHISKWCFHTHTYQSSKQPSFWLIIYTVNLTSGMWLGENRTNVRFCQRTRVSNR